MKIYGRQFFSVGPYPKSQDKNVFVLSGKYVIKGHSLRRELILRRSGKQKRRLIILSSLINCELWCTVFLAETSCHSNVNKINLRNKIRLENLKMACRRQEILKQTDFHLKTEPETFSCRLCKAPVI